jgi:hypothetical protein
MLERNVGNSTGEKTKEKGAKILPVVMKKFLRYMPLTFPSSLTDKQFFLYTLDK